jgi:hypothetical protein
VPKLKAAQGPTRLFIHKSTALYFFVLEQTLYKPDAQFLYSPAVYTPHQKILQIPNI